jgi:hypothetical protein
MTIWGKYKNKPIEKIDQASNQRDADYLVGEYRLAFGRDWIIWAGKKNEMPGSRTGSTGAH